MDDRRVVASVVASVVVVVIWTVVVVVSRSVDDFCDDAVVGSSTAIVVVAAVVDSREVAVSAVHPGEVSGAVELDFGVVVCVSGVVEPDSGAVGDVDSTPAEGVTSLRPRWSSSGFKTGGSSLVASLKYSDSRKYQRFSRLRSGCSSEQGPQK